MREKAVKRGELISVMENYVEAMLRKNPYMVRLAKGAKAYFNYEERDFGHNELWYNTTLLHDRQTFVDVVQNNIVLFGIATNKCYIAAGSPPEPEEGDRSFIPTTAKPFNALCVISLHIEDGRIARIEEFFDQQQLMRLPLSEIEFPDPLFEIPVPEDERMERDELKAIIDYYWDCIDRKKDVNKLPVHPDCVRIENGVMCSNIKTTFKSEFRLDRFRWRTPEDRRFFPVIDEARGVVVSFQEFGSLEEKSRPLTYILEIFKVQDGLLRFLKAFVIEASEQTEIYQ